MFRCVQVVSSVFCILVLAQCPNYAREVFCYRDDDYTVQPVVFSPDSSLLAVGNDFGNVRVFDTKNWKDTALVCLERGWPISAIAFSADSKNLIAGYLSLKEWSLPGGRVVNEYKEIPYGNYRSFVSFEAGICCKSLSEGDILIYDLKTQKLCKTLKGHRFMCGAVAFEPKKKWLATGGADFSIKLWDLDKLEELAAFCGHKYRISTLAFSPDGKELASGSWDGVRIYNLEKKSLRCTLKNTQAWKLVKVVFSPDGSRIVTGDPDGNLGVWDPGSGKELGRLRVHKGLVTKMAFSPNGKLLASSGKDQTLRVWKTEEFYKEAASNLEEPK